MKYHHYFQIETIFRMNFTTISSTGYVFCLFKNCLKIKFLISLYFYFSFNNVIQRPKQQCSPSNGFLANHIRVRGANLLCPRRVLAIAGGVPQFCIWLWVLHVGVGRQNSQLHLSSCNFIDLQNSGSLTSGFPVDVDDFAEDLPSSSQRLWRLPVKNRLKKTCLRFLIVKNCIFWLQILRMDKEQVGLVQSMHQLVLVLLCHQDTDKHPRNITHHDCSVNLPMEGRD